MKQFATRGCGVLFTRLRLKPALAVAMPLVFLLSGCDQLFQDRTTRLVDTGDKKYAAGDYPAAIQSYESALDGTDATAEVHYKLALLFDDKLKNPIAATYHFQRYLDLRPAGSHVKEVHAFMQEDQLKLVSSLSHGALMSQEDAARLKNDNLILRKQIAELRAQPRTPGDRAADAPPGGTQKPAPPGSTTYEVQRGDTLASIARKFYKNPARYKDIQSANYNALKGGVKLKAGMTLIIPKK